MSLLSLVCMTTHSPSFHSHLRTSSVCLTGSSSSTWPLNVRALWIYNHGINYQLHESPDSQTPSLHPGSLSQISSRLPPVCLTAVQPALPPAACLGMTPTFFRPAMRIRSKPWKLFTFLSFKDNIHEPSSFVSLVPKNFSSNFLTGAPQTSPQPTGHHHTRPRQFQ